MQFIMLIIQKIRRQFIVLIILTQLIVFIPYPSKRTVTPEERERRRKARWNITRGPYGLSLYRERLRKRSEFIDNLLIINAKLGLIGSLIYSVLKIIEIPTKNQTKTEKEMIRIKVRKLETMGLDLPLHTQQAILEEETRQRRKIMGMSP